MATNELIAKLNELSELRRMAEELNAEIEGVDLQSLMKHVV